MNPPEWKSRTPLTDDMRGLAMSFDMWATFAERLEIERGDAVSLLDIHVKRLRQAEALLGEITAECNWSLIRADGTPTKFYQRVMDFLQPEKGDNTTNEMRELLVRAYNDGIECSDGKDICHACPEKKRSICKDINAVLQPNISA